MNLFPSNLNASFDFVSGNIEILRKQNSLFSSGPCQSLSVNCYKIIRIVRALSLVNSCVKMRVWKHGCDITRILIGYVLQRRVVIGW